MFPFRAGDAREAAASSQTVHAVVIALVDARRFFVCCFSCVCWVFKKMSITKSTFTPLFFLRDESRHQRYRKNNFRIKRVLHFEYDGQTPLDFGEIFFRTGRLIRITQSRLVGDG